MKPAVACLQPPDVPLDADIRWVLLAAFADPYPADARPASAERAAELVQQFRLVSSITSRLSQEQLASALSPALQETLSQVARHRVMRSLAVAQARERVARAAVDASVDIVLLKQAALETLGLASQGQRYATDVDVLVDPDDVARFSDSLRKAGLLPEKGKTHAHGVVVLRTADDIGLELHTQLVDLRLPDDDAPIDFRRLKGHGLLNALASTDRIFTPSAQVLAAHLVAQGWYLFHFVPNAPHHKSPWRVIVDIGLLGLHRDPPLAERAYALIRHLVPMSEYSGLIALVDELCRGDLEHLSDDARRTANHAMAAALDEDYRSQLILPHQRYAILHEGLLHWARRNLARALLPSRSQIESQMQKSGVTTRLGARWQISSEMAASALRAFRASLGRRR